MPSIKDGVSIVVPTFRRAEGLRVALESLQSQTANGLAIEIIIADNDPAGSAKPFVVAFAKNATIPTHYLHVPEPGVSNARNGALEKAKGRYIAFLDDDQEAGENWLATLHAISTKYGAALSFVPTHARIPGKSKYDDYYYDFFSRFGPDVDEGEIDVFFGAGNSLLDRSLVELPSPVFSLEMNETGGEDDFLFSALKEQGIKIAWSRKALAYEDIRPHRAKPDYIKIRSFAFGQGPTQMCYDNSPRNYFGIAKWMIVGTLQYLLNMPLAGATKITNHASHIRFMDKAMQGAGKVLWFGRYRPKLYGAAVVENKAF